MHFLFALTSLPRTASSVRPRCPLGYLTRLWSGGLALAGAAGLGLAWPTAASACSTSRPFATSISAAQARSVFIGEVVFIYQVRLRQGEQVLAHLVRVRAAWRRPLPAYVVLEENCPGCFGALRPSTRYIFAFRATGHIGLDVPAERNDSDTAGWVWRLPGCADDRAYAPIDEAEVDPGGGIDFAPMAGDFRTNERRKEGAYMHTYRWKPDKARRMLGLREKELIGELSQVFGAPQPVPTTPPLADFADFAAAYIAAANAPQWPAYWEYAAAAAFQLSRLFGDDQTADLIDNAAMYAVMNDFVPARWLYWHVLDHLELLARLPVDWLGRTQPIFDTKAVAFGQLQLLRGLVSNAQEAAGAGYGARFVQADLIRDVLTLARMPRNWSAFPFGQVGPWAAERKNSYHCQFQSDPSCVWLAPLAERHQAALADLGMAYLRAELLRAGIQGVDGASTGRTPAP